MKQLGLKCFIRFWQVGSFGNSWLSRNCFKALMKGSRFCSSLMFVLSQEMVLMACRLRKSAGSSLPFLYVILES